MNILRAGYRFLYDFLIGDDWKVAAAVVLALSIGFVLVVAGVPASVVTVATALLLAIGFTVALLVDVRGRPGD